MTNRWDLVAFDRSGELALIVEAKNLPHTTPEWATRYRRNMLAHDISVPNVLFLLACPDVFHLWTPRQPLIQPLPSHVVDVGTPLEAIIEYPATGRFPDYTVDAAPTLGPFFERAATTPETVGREGFELLLDSWLNSLTWGDPHTDQARDQAWMHESGLLAALHDGRVSFEVAA